MMMMMMMIQTDTIDIIAFLPIINTDTIKNGSKMLITVIENAVTVPLLRAFPIIKQKQIHRQW